MQTQPSKGKGKKQPAKVPPPPPTEAEISLELIRKLIGHSLELTKLGPKFLDQVASLEVLYSVDLIVTKILDPLDVAADLKNIKVSATDTLEEVIASNDTLKELWMGEVYADVWEDPAIIRLDAELENLVEVLTKKSFKSFLKVEKE
jgi:hypothetical protein